MVIQALSAGSPMHVLRDIINPVLFLLIRNPAAV